MQKDAKRGRILVINPNCNPEITESFSEAISSLRLENGPEIECITNAEGPAGVESNEEYRLVIPMLERIVQERDDADAFVIACYSDPGVKECRKVTRKPLFGLQESGIFSAMQRGGQVGIVALGPVSIERHTRYIASLGLSSRIAAERPIHMNVAEAEAAAAFPKICEIGRQLKEIDHASALILGCAGMGRHRQPLEDEVGLPVIDPTQAAVAQALGAVLLASSE